MSKLYFNYAAMNAGKSTILLQSSYNYIERGMHTMLLKPEVDTRDGANTKILSRIGLKAEADVFTPTMNLFDAIAEAHGRKALDCVLIDEAQFLTPEQVWQLAQVADEMKIPVMCYGLRTDFQGQLFPGSMTLLAIADSVREIRTLCWCGRKATMNLRVDSEGRAVSAGNQVEIGGNELYISLCRSHWKAGRIQSGIVKPA